MTAPRLGHRRDSRRRVRRLGGHDGCRLAQDSEGHTIPPDSNSARARRGLPTAADWRGGLAGALVSLPVSMTYGVVAFSGLGPDHVGTGLVAGIYGAIAVSFFSVLAGSRTLLASGPRAAAAVVFSSVVLAVLQQERVAALGPDAVDVAIAAGLLTVALAGALQVAVGLARLGRVVRYMPVPVIAGFVNASAFIILLGQVPVLLGLDDGIDLAAWRSLPSQLLSAGTIAGVLTIVLMRQAPRITTRLPAPLLAIVGGVLCFHGLAALPGMTAGVTLQPIDGGAPRLFLTPAVLAVVDGEMLRDALIIVLPAALSMMALASFETLLSLTALDDRRGSRSAPDRELACQGLGNVAAALLGGVMGSGGLNRTTPLLDAGAQRPTAHLVSAVVMLLIVSLSYPLVQFVPQAVVAGMIIQLGWSLIDRWSVDLFRGAARTLWSPSQEIAAGGRARLLDAAIVAFVVGVALTSGMMAAVGVGVLLAVGVFVTSMSRSVIRSVRRGPGVHARRSWSPERQALLAPSAHRIVVVELDGVLFFGTAHGLEAAIDELLAQDVGWLILDFRRVADIDTSGARALLRIAARARRSGVTLCASGVRRERRRTPLPQAGLERRRRADPRHSWLVLEDAGAIDAIGAERFFDDMDGALARCENELIATTAPSAASRGDSLQRSVILKNFDRTDFRALRSRLDRVSFAPGETIFAQGAAGDSIYLVVAGSADIFIDIGVGGSGSVLHSVRAGSLFGEMAVLDGRPRAAGVRAVEALTCYRLAVDDFLTLQGEHPRAALKFYNNLCLVFSARLRASNALIAELEG
ncbi:MAG TPA: SulP family inorganic anion transporter [Pseudomonadales bacterium]|nr:SulP family inorganic anion transporter [Pseudomonadales bacterium]